MDRGPVTGFILSAEGEPETYLSGDTVWYEGIEELSGRFDFDVAMLFMGAATVPEVGPWQLTMTAQDAIQFARGFPKTAIVPLHFEGWRHFTESRAEIDKAFAEAGLAKRLKWVEAGRAVTVEAP